MKLTTPMLCAQGMLLHIAHDAMMCVSCNVLTDLLLTAQATDVLSCCVQPWHEPAPGSPNLSQSSHTTDNLSCCLSSSVQQQLPAFGAGLLAEVHMQKHAAAQVLMLFAGLSTCDPGNIQDTIKVAKQQRVRVSIVGLAAEVHICRVITEVSPCLCALL